MKKFFLSLVAALGLVAGLTLTSCGGGGGGDKSISGMRIISGAGIPLFEMNVQERLGESGVYTCKYAIGSSSYDGTFTLAPGYPMEEENKVIVKGQMGLPTNQPLREPDFMAWICGKSDALSVQLNTPIDLTITITGKNTAEMVREVDGLFYYKADASFPITTPVKIVGMYVEATKLLNSFKNAPVKR